MTAKQARKKADSFIKDYQLRYILHLIDVEADNGKYEILFYEPLQEATIKGLKKRMYKISEPQDDRNKYIAKISW